VDIVEIFRTKSRQLFWRELPKDRVVGGAGEEPVGAPIERDEAYFNVRMNEMYVRHARKLWRKFHPMLHGWVDYMGEETHAVAGPGQLQTLGERGLENAVILNHRLAGPTPYRGGELTVLTGLYSIPGHDASKALIDAVQTISSLAGVALGQAVPIANAVKNGVESILGLDKARLELGVLDSFDTTPLRPGYHVGVAAPAEEVPFQGLWLREGRLVQGSDPVAAAPYRDHDYMVVEIQRKETYDNWAALPGVEEIQEKFSAILGDGGLSVDDRKERLDQMWPEFMTLLRNTRELTPSDRKRIAHIVLQDLKNQLSAESPFETRSLADAPSDYEGRRGFDLLALPEISEYVGATLDPRALEGHPFA